MKSQTKAKNLRKLVELTFFTPSKNITTSIYQNMVIAVSRISIPWYISLIAVTTNDKGFRNICFIFCLGDSTAQLSL